MMPALKGRSAAGEGQRIEGVRAPGSGPQVNDTALARAAVKALRTELWIILQAAHRIAGGYGLSWQDYERLHEAHQHVLTVLREVR